MRTKSYMDIKAQWVRIEEYALKRGIWNQLFRAQYRYCHNICAHLNYHAMWTIQEDVNKLAVPVPVSVYAKPTEV